MYKRRVIFTKAKGALPRTSNASYIAPDRIYHVSLPTSVENLPQRISTQTCKTAMFIKNLVTLPVGVQGRLKNLDNGFLIRKFKIIITQVGSKNHFSLAWEASIPISHCKLII
jgi:hypothetical protein